MTYSEEIEEELEALPFIYGEEAVRITRNDDSPSIEVDLQPRVELGAALVSLTLGITLPAGYPAAALPVVRVERSRGLGNASVASVVAASNQACQEHGLQEVGFIGQLLAEVSEALDAANDSSECNICLSACSPGEDSVHAPCDHIFHTKCLGHWAALKAAEADEAAGQATATTVATRDALRRELHDLESSQEAIQASVENARRRVVKASSLVDAARAKQGQGHAADCEIDPAIEAELVNEEGEDIPLETLVERAKHAKTEEKQLISDEKKASSRRAELWKKLEQVEKVIDAEAASRAAAPLPCPVCRAPIDRKFTMGKASGMPVVKDEPSVSARSVSSLPEDLRAQVRDLQARNEAILKRRAAALAAAEAAEAEAANAEAASAEPVPADAAPKAEPVLASSGTQHRRGGRGGGSAVSRGRGRGVANNSGNDDWYEWDGGWSSSVQGAGWDAGHAGGAGWRDTGGWSAAPQSSGAQGGRRSRWR